MVMNALVESPHVVAWLVDPSMELQEAGVECTLQAASSSSSHPPRMMQWRANDVAEKREESANEHRTSDLDDTRDNGSTPPKSIFRKLKRKIRLMPASSTDAVTDEAPSINANNTFIVPSMIHLQRASSRDSVECVLADVFMLPTSSSTVTDEFSDDDDDDASITTMETVVIDAQALESEFNNGIPSNIQVPTKETIECVLLETPSLRSATSSMIMTVDSSDDGTRRLADLMAEEEERDSATDASQQYNDDGSISTQCSYFDCTPLCFDCHSVASKNMDAVARFFLPGSPSTTGTLPGDGRYDRYNKNLRDFQPYKCLDQLSAVPSEEFDGLLLLAHENCGDGEPSIYLI